MTDPQRLATATRAGLMSPGDKARLAAAALSGVNTDITSLNGPALGAATATTTAAGDRSTAVATTAFVGQSLGAVTSDINVAQQNILFQGLLLAALRGVPTGLVDGVLDPFSSTADINTGASSGFTFNGGAGTIQPTPGGYTAPYTTVSAPAFAIADSSNSGTTATTAYDGDISSFWQPNGNVVGGSYNGQDFGQGQAPIISQIALTQHTNSSYVTTSVLVQYADGPSGPWTTATTATGLTVGVNTIAVPGMTGHRCWRLLLNASTSGGLPWTVAEIAMRTGTAASPAAMTLQSATLASAVASPADARILLQVDGISAASTPNTDLAAFFSRDGGATFTQGTLSMVQQMPDGTTVYDTGYFSVSGQPAGNSTMTYKVTTPTRKAIVLTGAGMQVRP